jgi:hypothetical protein
MQESFNNHFARVVHCVVIRGNPVTMSRCQDLMIAHHYDNYDVTVTIKKITMEIINLHSPYWRHVIFKRCCGRSPLVRPCVLPVYSRVSHVCSTFSMVCPMFPWFALCSISSASTGPHPPYPLHVPSRWPLTFPFIGPHILSRWPLCSSLLTPAFLLINPWVPSFRPPCSSSSVPMFPSRSFLLALCHVPHHIWYHNA